MAKKVIRQGSNERSGEVYVGLYVKPLRDASTKVVAFFNILLGLS